MSKSPYKFKNYQKTNGDEHISSKLEKDHSPKAPNSTTEEQLEENRFPVEIVPTEKMLEKARTGSATVVTEKNLNDSTSNFNIQYRDSSTSAGNINKLEEQRVAKAKMEDEKYEPASETPTELRWWQKEADTKKKIKTAQIAPLPSEAPASDEYDEDVRADQLASIFGNFIEDEQPLPDTVLATNNFRLIEDKESGGNHVLAYIFDDTEYTGEEAIDIASLKS